MPVSTDFFSYKPTVAPNRGGVSTDFFNYKPGQDSLANDPHYRALLDAGVINNRNNPTTTPAPTTTQPSAADAAYQAYIASFPDKGPVPEFTYAEALNASGLDWSQLTADPKYKPLIDAGVLTPGMNYGEYGAPTVINWNKIKPYAPKGISPEMMQKLGDAGMHFIPTNGSDLVDPRLVWDDPTYGKVTLAGNNKSDYAKTTLDWAGPLAMAIITMGAGALAGAGAGAAGAAGAGSGMGLGAQLAMKVPGFLMATNGGQDISSGNLIGAGAGLAGSFFNFPNLSEMISGIGGG